MRRILIFALILGSVSYVSAQSTDTEDATGKTFRATSFNQWQGVELFAKSKSSYLPLNPAKSSYTRSFRYVGNTIVLYKEGLSDEGKEIFLEAMKVVVPPSVIEPLLILAWDGTHKKGVAKVIEFSPSKFRYGSYQIVNFSQLPLGGYIGSKSNKVVCLPGKEYITSFNFEEGKAAAIVFYVRENNELKKVFGSITTHRNRKRAVYLMYPERNKLNKTVFKSSVIVDVARASDS